MISPQEVGGFGLVVSASLSTIGWALYTFRGSGTSWWTWQPGRFGFALLTALTVVLDLSAARILLGAGLDAAWFVWLRVGVFVALIPAVLAWATVLLLLARWKDRR